MTSSTNGAWKLDFNIQKNESRSLSFTMHKTQLQTDQGPKHMTSYPSGWKVEQASTHRHRHGPS